MQQFGFPQGKRSRMPKAVPWAGRVAALLLYTGALSGCADIAFKRGSGPDAFAADRQACQTRNANPDAVRTCLAAAGWHITDLDPATSPAPPPLAPPQPAEPAPSAPAQPTPAPPPPTPTKTLHVGGWWKFGAGAADLQTAANACVKKLGPANTPDAGYHTITPPLYACLGTHGWHALAHPTLGAAKTKASTAFLKKSSKKLLCIWARVFEQDC
jgi:hypothetical protein